MRRLLVVASFFLAGALGLSACGQGQAGKLECTSDEECFEGYACGVVDSDKGTKICLRACTSKDDCLASEKCDIPNGATQGVCRYDTQASGTP